jgi:ribosomal protein RSM22 (predicted rRNA methylase)
MQLPANLHRAVLQALALHASQSLSSAATELSQNYRDPHARSGAFMATERHRLAYLAVRMPATYSANSAVFTGIQSLLPGKAINSLLDLGAGPGTASWAAMDVFPELQNITLVERDSHLIDLGKSLAHCAENTRLQNTRWVEGDLGRTESFRPHDLVVCSYALNEMDPEIARKVLSAAWTATHVALVVIEPGTMPGFHLIRRLRDDLIRLGAHLIAPCPHQNTCPQPPGDWCHFSQRVNRTALHRQIKTGDLGYEDEKYSYLAASKSPVQTFESRVLRHPIRHPGRALLQLCAQEGIMSTTITRSDKQKWLRARKARWGDPWP